MGSDDTAKKAETERGDDRFGRMAADHAFGGVVAFAHLIAHEMRVLTDGLDGACRGR